MSSSTNAMLSEQPLGAAPYSPKKLARIAGVFYLMVAIAGGFAQGVVDPRMYAAGDAAASTANLVGNVGLIRLAVVAHLTDAVFFVLVAMTLYVLLKHAGKQAARLMVTSVVLAAGITAVSAVFTFVALQVATDDSYQSAFGLGGSQALVLLLLQIEHYGILAAQVFFGLWLAPLGYLAYRSGLFPKPLGIVLAVTTVSYLLDVVAAFLLPELAGQVHGFLSLMPIVGEVWLLLYLLIIGVRSPRGGMRPAVDGRASQVPGERSAARV
jgi:hypothetical protein